jgi:RNA polymerase sigma-70 factor (sigma-E family)
MARDHEAFDAFVAARSPALLRSAYLLCGDRGRAEDLVQTALAKVWLRWDRVGAMDHVEAYVRRVLFSGYVAWWRRGRREVAVADVPDGRRLDHAGGVGDRTDVTAALRRLPKGQRAVVVLRFYEDMTEAQAAEVLGCSVGTVKSQTARALARLRGDLALTAARGGVAVAEETR